MGSTQSSIQMDIPGVELRDVSATAKDGLTKQEWRRALKRVARLAGSSQWWIGDLFVHGESRFGDGYAVAASKVCGLKPKTVREYAYVSGAVPPEVRRLDLTHAHHSLVAPFKDVDEQKRRLAFAAEHDLTVKEFRREIDRGEPTPPTYESRTADDIETCPTCGQPVRR